jgi:hypothetical protein
MPPTSMLNRAQRPHEPARLRALLALMLLLSGGEGLAALAQDAYGGITGAKYPNPYPQSGTYFNDAAPPVNADVQSTHGRRSRRAAGY